MQVQYRYFSLQNRKKVKALSRTAFLKRPTEIGRWRKLEEEGKIVIVETVIKGRRRRK